MNRRTLRVRDCETWSGSIDDIIATAAYLEKAGYQQEARPAYGPQRRHWLRAGAVPMFIDVDREEKTGQSLSL
jgi:hypothetical protein